RGFDLLAQLLDKGSQVFELVAVVRSPDGPEDLLVPEDTVRVLDQITQKIKFFGRKMHFPARGIHLPCLEINLDFSQIDPFWLGVDGIPAQMGTDARDQFSHAER